MTDLLTKTRKINTLLQQKNTFDMQADLPYDKMAVTLGGILDSNTYIIGSDGVLLGYNERHDVNNERIKTMFVEKQFPESYTDTVAQLMKTEANIAGVVTEKTEQFFTEKRAFYREIEAQIAELEQSESPNSYQIGQLTAQLNDKAAFEKFAQRVEQIPDSAEIFYDTGYVRYFALDGNREGMVQVLLLTAALTLLLCPTTSMDCKTNLKQIYHATKIGRFGYLRQMFRFAILNGILFSAVLILPYLLQILNHYGMQGWNTPLAGIEAYSTCPARISVGAAAIGVMGIRTIGAALTGCSITWIASHCKSLVTAYCINGVLFVLPAGLCLLGLDMFRYVGLTPMLYGII